MNEKQKKSGLDEIITLMSGMLSKETIIELLECAISDYKDDPSEEKYKDIGSMCFLFLNREMVDQTGGGFTGAQKFNEMRKEVRSKVDFFEPPVN